MGNISKWKESLSERTVSRQSTNLMQLVYGNSTSMKATSIDEEDSSGNSGDEESDGDDFFRPKGEGNKVCPRYCIVYGDIFLFFFIFWHTIAGALLTSKAFKFLCLFGINADVVLIYLHLVSFLSFY